MLLSCQYTSYVYAICAPAVDVAQVCQHDAGNPNKPAQEMRSHFTGKGAMRHMLTDQTSWGCHVRAVRHLLRLRRAMHAYAHGARLVCQRHSGLPPDRARHLQTPEQTNEEQAVQMNDPVWHEGLSGFLWRTVASTPGPDQPLQHSRVCDRPVSANDGETYVHRLQGPIQSRDTPGTETTAGLT